MLLAITCSVAGQWITTATPAASADPTTADDLVQRVLESDPWGLSGATIKANITLTDRNGKQRKLAFVARSRRYDSPFSKWIIRFTAPADLAGAGFLQVQSRTSDDDRYLFLPELKRSRRISGSLRSNSFMGTDFSFADLDRRDLREGTATLRAEEPVGNFPCHKFDVAPTRADSPYSRIELWIRKDSYLPLKMVLFDKSNVVLKEFRALEVRRVTGQWFVTKSKMTNVRDNHVTDLELEQILVEEVPDDAFTVRELEKL
jgi:outer membrane lipoprotein-sorting protein